MGNSGSPEYRARRRERERQRRQHVQRAPTKKALPDPADAEVDGRARRVAATACGWCGGPITPRSRGPIPKWCSATCRHRAWEQARAAASERAAIQVVERHVQVRVPLEPTRRDWPKLLVELAGQLNDGRVYDRDLPGLARALEPRAAVLPTACAHDRGPRRVLSLDLRDFCSNWRPIPRCQSTAGSGRPALLPAELEIVWRPLPHRRRSDRTSPRRSAPRR
jgi:hypothetical protein